MKPIKKIYQEEYEAYCKQKTEQFIEMCADYPKDGRYKVYEWRRDGICPIHHGADKNDPIQYAKMCFVDLLSYEEFINQKYGNK